MSAHRPKTAALLAFAEDLLSPEGRARVERHLDGCEVCRRELAAIELYERMAADARDAPMPAIDFDKMDFALAKEARKVTVQGRDARGRSKWPLVGLAIAAAAMLALYEAWPAEPSAPEEIAHTTTPRVTPSPEPVAPTPEPALLSPVVTLAAGTVTRDDDPVAVGDVLPEGGRVVVGEGSLLHARLSEGTAIVATADTELGLDRLREDAVRISLGRGRIGQDVAPLASGSSYVILCAGYEVEVRGTHFVVSYLEGVVGVDLSEGTVALRTPEGETIELVAPARWRSSGEGAEGEPDEVSPWEAAEPLAPVTLATLAHPQIVRWRVDEHLFETEDSLALRLTHGDHGLEGWDARGRLFTGLLRVGDAPVMLDPGALTPEAPRLREGHLSDEEIQQVLVRGRRQIQQCYERALRGSGLSGHGRLRVTVGVMGEVTQARLLGLEGDGAASLSTCVANYASHWTFSPPGGPVTFELPLALTQTQ